jgi:hypothetical protein
MRRPLVCLGILLFALLATSCGSPESHSPSVTVKSDGSTLLLHSGAVMVFYLVPRNGPSGLLALKSVHDGLVRTLGSLRFKKMSHVGSVAVQVGSRTIDVAWSVDGVQVSPAEGPIAFPSNTVASGTAWTGITVGPADFAGEVDFWTMGRYADQQPAQDSDSVGGFDGVAAESLDRPTKTSYYLTIAVDKDVQPSD